MSEEKRRKRLRHFLQEFLLPFLRGGDLHIHLPINAEELAYFPKGLTEPEFLPIQAEIEEARERVSAEWTRASAPFMQLRDDPAALTLTAVIYNLLFLSHPSATSIGGGGSARSIAEFSSGLLRRVPEAKTGTQALAYHSLLEQLSKVYRTDTEVRWWVGREEFQGTTPPARLLYWKSVRRVTETKTKTVWVSSELSERQTALLEEIFARSPLSEWTSTHPRHTPKLRPSLLAVSEADLLRALTGKWLEREPLAVAESLARAFFVGLGLTRDGSVETAPNPPAPLSTALLRRGGQLLYHFVTTALYLRGETFLNQLAAAREDAGKVVLRAVAALLVAEEGGPGLGIPKDLLGGGERPFDKSLRALLSLALEVAGESSVQESAQRVQQRLTETAGSLRALP